MTNTKTQKLVNVLLPVIYVIITFLLVAIKGYRFRIVLDVFIILLVGNMITILLASYKLLKNDIEEKLLSTILVHLPSLLSTLFSIFIIATSHAV